MSAVHLGKNGYITAASASTLPLLGRNRGNTATTNVVLISAESSIVDIGGNPVTITNTSAAVNTLEPFTSTLNSVRFSGTSHLAMSNAVFSAGTGDFTLECWIYLATRRTYSVIADTQAAGAAGARNNGFVIWADQNGAINLFSQGSTQFTTASNTIPATTWKHVRLTRVNGVVYLFIDGTLNTTWSTSAAAVNLNQGAMLISRLADSTPSTSNTMDGYVSNWRWVKGSGLNIQSFTSPTSDLSATVPLVMWIRNYGIKQL